MRLKDKVVVLTGAASGIGRAVAQLFAKEGAIVVLSDINENGLKETYNSLKEGKERAEIVRIDVTKAEEVKKMIENTIKKYNQIDILIPNAGVVRVGAVEDFPDSDYDLLINVNLKGVHYTCKYTIPFLKKQKQGVIVIVASVSAHIGQVNHANYASTKAGALAYCRALAMDLAPYGIRVNSVSPGATDTPMLQSDVAKQAKERGVAYDKVKKEFEAEGVMGRWATPMEIAYGILFLASGDSSYMTGTDILIDGGWTAR
jgi:NAD(P)-dependent dehydrogenase (short-subunit alcohol dehydrogenase family)